MNEQSLILTIVEGEEIMPFSEALAGCTLTEVAALLDDRLGFTPKDTLVEALDLRPVRVELMGFVFNDDALCVLAPGGDVTKACLGDYVRLNDYRDYTSDHLEPSVEMFRTALLRVAIERLCFTVALTDAAKLYEPLQLDVIRIMNEAQITTLGAYERPGEEGPHDLVVLVGFMLPRAVVEGHVQLHYPGHEAAATAVELDGLELSAEANETGLGKLAAYLKENDVVDLGLWWLGMGEQFEQA